MNRIKRRATGLIAAACLVPALGGCYNGFDAGTQKVDSAGDSAQAQVGNIQIRGANWVRSAKDERTFTLVANYFNAGATPDMLTAVTTEPAGFGKVAITGGGIVLPSLLNRQTGYNSDLYTSVYGLTTPMSSYINTTFVFKNAGTVTAPILVVPPTGIYEGIAPNIDPELPNAVVPSDTASPSATASVSARPSRGPESP